MNICTSFLETYTSKSNQAIHAKSTERLKNDRMIEDWSWYDGLCSFRLSKMLIIWEVSAVVRTNCINNITDTGRLHNTESRSSTEGKGFKIPLKSNVHCEAHDYKWGGGASQNVCSSSWAAIHQYYNSKAKTLLVYHHLLLALGSWYLAACFPSAKWNQLQKNGKKVKATCNMQIPQLKVAVSQSNGRFNLFWYRLHAIESRIVQRRMKWPF